MSPPPLVVAVASAGWTTAGEKGGATLVGLALAGFVLMAGLVAVDVGALVGARAAAQTAADLAALAALSPQTGTVAGSAQSWGEARAAGIAAANGAELVACACSGVEAVVRVRRRLRLVPGGLSVSVGASARAVLAKPPASRATVRAVDLLRVVDGEIWRSVSEASPRARAPADLRANASAAAAAAVLFGASVVAVRVAVRDVPPVSLAVLRFGLGGLLLAGILLVVAPRSLRARWERLPRFALLGLVLFVLFPLTFNVGLRYTEASRGAVMLATMPIWSALLGRVVGERLTRLQVVGVALSVVGIGVAFVEPGRAVGGDAMRLVGDGLLLLTGLLGAVYGLLAKRVLAVDSPATVTTWAMLFGAVLLLPVAVVEGLFPAIGRLDGQLLGVVVFLGVLGGAAAFLLWTWALSRLTPTQVAVYVNLNPVVAALLGVVLLGERRSGLFLLGFTAVVAGVVLVNWPGRRT
jgi:drug/metabolite transporter (DMT)-like permease